MTFFSAYKAMKKGKIVSRSFVHRYLKVRKLKIINGKFRMFNTHYGWDNAVQISIEDLDATDWEVVDA